MLNLQNMPKMSGNGNIAPTARVCGEIITVLILIVLFTVQSSAQIYAINCYDSTFTSAGNHPIKMKFIDLATKEIVADLEIAEEGEIINTTPVEIPINRDTVLLTALSSQCYCKNTAVGSYNAHFTIVSKESRNILRQIDIPHELVSALIKDDNHLFYLSGFRNSERDHTDINGIYEITRNFDIDRVRTPSIDYFPNTTKGLTNRSFSKLISGNFFFDVKDGNYFIIKTNNLNNEFLDTLKCYPLESRSQIFALKDTLLYVFSINYELRISDRIEKAYGQDWISSNVRTFNTKDFTLIDSLSLLDYPEGSILGLATSGADVIGPFIIFYFGESSDMEIIYPAMLFIFDTRTNEATWLRVGWR
jgi:hypothetical protein